LKITGRIKEQFKTTKGKYVSPSKIEGLLSTHPAVEQCLVFGANQAAPCGVVVLTQAAVKQASTETGRKALTDSFKELLASIDRQVETHEHLAFVALVNSPWTIESGFITPTMKLKRMPLEAFYAPLIQSWREQYSTVVWHLT
jgi:long-chain acyl-CoA synthetase